ncbi:amidohydrolase family protein [Pseudomonas asuensis]|uniref:2-pyrone-4,6-dicarboxylate hydrolase n=1 Tax=Pseudomonas asuensis TaxID=1825787 RepID=A0ABQ2GZ15_9PSED|nr:amidohydrolase family protein [Pseudomonas asuensis]GGM20846.1 2-pyrone-4,6-dicarboxylate hydrolase [Pseudomonas asuensis]
MSIYGEYKIDCHTYLLEPTRFPLSDNAAYTPVAQEVGTATQLQHVFNAYGVRHALVITPPSVYGSDNRCLLDALSLGFGRWKGIAMVGSRTSTRELKRLKDAGVVGVLIDMASNGISAGLNAEELFNQLADLDMVAQLHIEKEQLSELMPLIERTQTRLIIDHCGKPEVAAGVGQPGFQALLSLAGRGRVYIKFSGLSHFSAESYPYVDTHPYVQALLETFGPEACLWGSDWPFLNSPERVDYGLLLKLIENLIPSPGARRQVLWDTPRTLFGFKW